MRPSTYHGLEWGGSPASRPAAAWRSLARAELSVTLRLFGAPARVGWARRGGAPRITAARPWYEPHHLASFGRFSPPRAPSIRGEGASAIAHARGLQRGGGRSVRRGTQKVVKKFQLARGLPVDGWWGPRRGRRFHRALDAFAEAASSVGRVERARGLYLGVVVSSRTLRKKLRAIAKFFNWHITVHHGNRTGSVTGGSKTSLHLSGRAADFHIKNVSDQAAFSKARFSPSEADAREYELIWHGTGTHTGGPHLHMGAPAGAGVGVSGGGDAASPGGRYSPTRLRN
jgi:hypothetical protein